MKRFIAVTGLVIIFTGQVVMSKHVKELEVTRETYSSTYQNDYTQIETDEISKVIVNIIEETYPGSGIAEAFIDNTGNYKLIIVINKSSKTVYINSIGEWFNP